MVILDTSIFIDALRRKSNGTVLQWIVEKVKKSEISYSMITLQELYQGKSIEEVKNEDNLKALIFPLQAFPYTFEVAKKAGEIVRDSNYTKEFADAAIAATAIVNGASLVTLDKKDFSGIRDLVLFD